MAMNITTAVIVLAKQAAIKGVKREMAAQAGGPAMSAMLR
jgi:hypothetical protein